MPSTEGPASGLRNTVCICKPLTAKPAPAMMAVKACGSRDFHTMFVQISWLSSPVRMRHTSAKGMRTEPMSRLTTVSTTMAASKAQSFHKPLPRRGWLISLFDGSFIFTI